MLPLAHVSTSFGPLELIPLTVAAAAYGIRAANLSRTGTPVPPWKLASFLAGIALLFAALISPVAHIAEELVVGHMVQHLVMGDLAALLIVLGLTGPVLRPLLASRALGWTRTLFHPAVALPLWVANLYFWHIPAIYQEVLTSGALHAAMHAGFVGAGVMMWMSLLGPLPKPAWFGYGWQLGYVAAVRLAGAGLGNIFMWSGTVFYPAYEPGESYWGISPLADQGAAGIVMTLEGAVVTLAALAWVMLRWAKQSEKRQRLLDLAEERGVRLDPERAERAAAAGGEAASRLEERLRR